MLTNQQQQQSSKKQRPSSNASKNDSTGGRPRGSKNQPGHKACGNRKSESFRMTKEGDQKQNAIHSFFVSKGDGSANGTHEKNANVSGEGGVEKMEEPMVEKLWKLLLKLGMPR